MMLQRQNSNSSATVSSGRCCDYRKLNLLAFAGTLVYVGYLFGSLESGSEISLVAAVNSAFSNSGVSIDDTDGNSEDRRGSLRAASASASWDRISALSASASWDYPTSSSEAEDVEQEDTKPEKDSSADVAIEEPFGEYTKGPVIYNNQGPVTSINLIGERHSGTNWITDHLVDCFGDQITVCMT